MRLFPLSVAIASAIALGVACGENPPPAAPGAAAPKAGKPAAAAAATGADGGVLDSAAYVYSYNPMGKRDPFRSPVADLVARAEGNSACTEPLCQWDLDQLKLVAVVTGDANPLAMVEDPQSRGYIIHRGTKVGKQGGQVTQILRDSITVTEYFQSPDGKRNPNPVTMRLKADAQAQPEMDFVSGKSIQ